MSDDIFFNDILHQTSFLDSLQYIPHVMTGSEIPIPPIPANFYVNNGLTSLPPSVLPYTTSLDSAATPLATAQAINTYLTQFSLPTSPGPTGPTVPFTNFAAFQTGVYAAMGIPVGPGLYNGLLQEFASALNIQIDASGNVTGGDWQILVAPPAAAPPPNFSSSNATNPFILAFNQFLSKYPYPQSPVAGALGYYATFLTNWHQFLSGIALLTPPASSDPLVFQDLATYQAIFNSFSSDTSAAAFKARLNQFYQDEMNSKGYFMPSQMLADWVTAIRNDNMANLINMEKIGSSLSGNSSEKALVLNRIIRLLIALIQTLQNVGIAQANRLTFITKFQNVYTALQTQIPVFLKDGSKPLGDATTEAGQARNDLNSSFNGVLTDNLRNLRGIQEDAAKKEQTNVNQTNDAVNQQTDMCSTFIQQLSTLLNTVVH